MCKCIWAFLSFIYQIPPIQFSLHFGEKTFWWAQRENTWALLIFSLPSLQPNTHQKSFPSRFLSKIFHPPYFISKQTHCRYSGHAFWPLALCNFPLSHIKEFFSHFLLHKLWSKGVVYHQLFYCGFSGHAFWPLALCNFPLSHIEESFPHFLPYKLWSEGVVYHQLLS